MPRYQHKEYYVVMRGRGLEKPIIYSSWAKAHIRTTGCDSSFKGFGTYTEALAYLAERGNSDYDIDIVSETEQTEPGVQADAYYAVACGLKPGIKPYFNGPKGAKLEVDKHKHCCHKRFRTYEQAEQFLADWREHWLEVMMAEMWEQLKKGWHPDVNNLFGTPLRQPRTDDLSDELGSMSLSDRTEAVPTH